MKLESGVYESEYGNAVAWDGRKAVDLDMMEEVPVDVIVPDSFIRPLEGEDRVFISEASSLFGGEYRGY